MSKKLLWPVAVLILLAGNVFLGWQYYNTGQELKSARTVLSAQKDNEKVRDFMAMFIKKVIKIDTEVDFETRLKLENTVRELGDQAILDQWLKFVNSFSEADAQRNVKDLLDLLAEKISVN